jgi:hypothetical protein
MMAELIFVLLQGTRGNIAMTFTIIMNKFPPHEGYIKCEEKRAACEKEKVDRKREKKVWRKKVKIMQIIKILSHKIFLTIECKKGWKVSKDYRNY